ncbi:MAG: hypothetical protein HDS11_06465 [Bacteroides sp.]|nr:hypothetical protein [Bacteroidales bacterium]MBD5317291.1 hypothetical protein [Bacteroides sp.]MBD5377457.1 hypothetical protein [Bacteroides sp.]
MCIPDTPVSDYFTRPERLSAAETGARGELTMAALERRIIVAATEHADNLGVGYDELLTDGNAWVLSRMSIEMERMPRIHDTFRIVTWIETINRHLSERNASIIDAEGRPMGHARSLWACINIASRRPASINMADAMVSSRPCPIAPQPRLRPVEAPSIVAPCRFTYSDIDFNRHVNSARYVEHIDNCFPLSFHDGHRLQRIDIAYLREAPYDSEALVKIAPLPDSPLTFSVDIDSAGAPAVTHCRALLRFVPCPSSGFMAKI